MLLAFSIIGILKIFKRKKKKILTLELIEIKFHYFSRRFLKQLHIEFTVSPTWRQQNKRAISIIYTSILALFSCYFFKTSLNICPPLLVYKLNTILLNWFYSHFLANNYDVNFFGRTANWEKKEKKII